MRYLLWVSITMSMKFCQSEHPLVISWVNNTRARNDRIPSRNFEITNAHQRNRQLPISPRWSQGHFAGKNSHVSRQNIRPSNWNARRRVSGNPNDWNSRGGTVPPRQDAGQGTVITESSSNFTMAQKREIVDLHNKIRRSVHPRASNMKIMVNMLYWRHCFKKVVNKAAFIAWFLWLKFIQDTNSPSN